MEHGIGGSSNQRSDASDGNSTPNVIPVWQEISILLFKIERLATGAAQAIESGDKAAAASLTAKANEAIREAKAFAERARAQ